MPYVVVTTRAQVDNEGLNALCERAGLQIPGELAYMLYRLFSAFVGGRPSYSLLSSLVGVVTSTMHEFERRVMWPYEDAKRQQNGDVF